MVIFGWGGGKVKNHGPALSRACPSCGHEGFFHYFTITKWFRLYFIPIIPYSTVHFLGCPICTAGTELTSGMERQRVHALVAATAALHSGVLTEEAYMAQIRAAFGAVAPAPSLPAAPSIDRQHHPSSRSDASARMQPGDTWSG